ncbi:MAG: MFS transporter [Nitrososphaerota archaeon]|nr:MFS transporter [Nitrososphaerota archaeon]
MSDRISIPSLIGVRIFRSIAAGLINITFPYIILVELYHNSHQGSLILGFIYTLAAIATAVLGLSLGFSADLIGKKITFLIALLLLPFSVILLGYATSSIQSLPLIFLAASVGGFSATGSLAGGGVGGAAGPIQSLLVTEITKRSSRTFYFSIFSFVSALASAAGAFIAGLLSITDVLTIATVMGFISTFLALLVRIPKPDTTVSEIGPQKEENADAHIFDPPSETKHEERPPLGRIWMGSARNIGKFTATGMLNGISQGLVAPFLIPFFIIVYAIPRPEMATYATISGVAGAFALLLAPRIERALGFLKGLMITRALSAVLVLAMAFIRLLPVSLGIYFLIPPLRTLGMPMQQTAMMDMVDRKERGRAFGINQSARLGASSAGTAFAGYEFNLSEIEVPFVLYALVLGMNVYLYYTFFSSYRPPPETLSGPEE